MKASQIPEFASRFFATRCLSTLRALLAFASLPSLAGDAEQQIDRTIVELLLSKADLVAVVELDSEPGLERLPLWQQDQLMHFRPLTILKGRLPPDGLRLAVAIPVARGSRSYVKGQQFIVFLASTPSGAGAFWRPVSVFGIQPRDGKTETLIREISPPSSVPQSTSGIRVLQTAPASFQMAPATYFPYFPQARPISFPTRPPVGDDPGAMDEYRQRIDAMPGRLPLPTLRASKVERLMESGGSR